MQIKKDVNLSQFTTFGIGGNSDYFTTVGSKKDLVHSIEFAQINNLDYYILAGGSNILFSDSGFRGIIIHMDIDCINICKENIVIGSGARLSDLVLVAKNNGLTGAERLVGIPGTVGGAVRGNAGAFGLEIADVLESVTVYDKSDNKAKFLDVSSCEYGYRTSLFKKNKDYIVLEASFSFRKGDKREIEKQMYNFLEKRTKKQLQDIKSAGSFFINPIVSKEIQNLFYKDSGIESKDGRVPAGWLLDSVGLSRKRIGDAQAGYTHANYFLNLGKASASDVIQLASLAKTRVRDKFGVQLKEEVELVGF